VQALLFRFAEWHALAKLRIHSESTVTILEDTFKKLSQMLRKFQGYTCAAFNAVELPKEKAARQRKAQSSDTSNASPDSSGARPKKFNLGTYKFHAMGDYARTIRLFGTTDSFTTQIVCGSHIYTMFLTSRLSGRACSQSPKGILPAYQQARYTSTTGKARA
jgi:hypothetical protein